MSSTEKLKTLLILTPGFPESESDTACLPFLQSHVPALQKASPDTEIIVIAFQYPYYKGTYRWNDFDVIAFDGRGRPRLKRFLIWIKVWKELIHLRRTRNIIGLFSVWCTECSMIAHYFGKWYGIKNFIWICGQDAKKTNRYVKLIRPVEEELIAKSNFLQREYKKNHGVTPKHMIPNGIDPVEFMMPDSYRDIDILGVGNLIPLKQYDMFVDIVHELKTVFPDLMARICGKGTENDRLNSMIRNLQLQNQISLEGELPHKEILKLMKRTKILLHTSAYEGLGMVCLEALYAGAHVVSFTKPMDQEINHWHHVNNKKEMVRKVSELLENNVSNSPVIPYPISTVATQITELFNI